MCLDILRLLWSLFIYTSLLLSSTAHTANVDDIMQEPVINRLNFGALFYYEKPLYTVSTYYTHHLVLNLPDNASSIVRQAKGLRTLLLSNRLNSSVTAQNLPIVRTISTILLSQTYHLMRVSNLINQVTPFYSLKNEQPTGIKKRSDEPVVICSFCGQFYRTAFGLSTLNDLQQLRFLVEQEHNLTANRFQLFAENQKQLASWSLLVDSKIASLTEVTRTYHDMLWNFVSSLNQHEQTIENLANTIRIVSQFTQDESDFAQLYHALVLLQRGILSHVFLSLDEATKIYEGIQNSLATTGIYYLTHANPQSIFTLRNTFAFRSDKYLHLILRLPLTSFKSKFSLYRLEVVPLNVQNHSTQIQISEKFLAVNYDDEFYLTFNSPLPPAEDEYYHLQDNVHVVKHKTQPSCISALFYDLTSQIANICPTVLMPFRQKSMVIPLGNDKYFFQNIRNYTLISLHAPAQQLFTNCDACIIMFPCDHRIETAIGIFFSSHCEHNITITHANITAYVTNFHTIIPLLSESDKLLNQLSSSMTFDAQQNISLPLLKVYQQTEAHLTRAWKTLEQPSIDLAAAINQSLKKEEIYAFQSDEILHNLQKLGVQFKYTDLSSFLASWISPLQFPTTIAIILLYILVFALGFKIYMMAGSTVLLPTATAQVATTTMSFEKQLNFYIQSLITTAKPTPHFILETVKNLKISSDVLVVDLLIFFLLIFSLTYFVYKRIRRHLNRNTCDIYFEFAHGNLTCQIHALKLPHSYTLYEYSAKRFVSGVNLAGCFLPKLLLDFSTLVIRNKFTAVQTRLPRSYRLSYFQFYKMRKILREEHSCLLFVRDVHQKEFKLMPLQGTHWVLMPAQTTMQSNLYPLLPTSPPQYA